MMNVALTNDVSLVQWSDWICSSLERQGPVTLTIDSRKFEYVDVPAVAKKRFAKNQELPNNAALE